MYLFDDVERNITSEMLVKTSHKNIAGQHKKEVLYIIQLGTNLKHHLTPPPLKTLISGGICDGYFSKCPFLVIQINDIAGSHIDKSVLPNDIVREKVVGLIKMLEDVVK